jgi:hypothetical protein
VSGKEEELLDFMANTYWIRQTLERNKELMHIDGLRLTAHMLADYITTSSLEEIRERAITKKEPEAMLKLADFYMYGLRNLPRDQQKAEKYYTRAAEAGSPEACIQVAYLAYDKMIKEQSNFNDNEAIPVSKKPPQELQVMWKYLEKAIKLNYLTPFLVQMIDEAKETGSWTPSRVMEKILTRRRMELDAEIRNEKASYQFSCRNSRCEIKFNHESGMFSCGQCKLVRINPLLPITVYQSFST